MDSDSKGQMFRIPRNALVKREELRQPRASKAFGVFLDISGYTSFADTIIKRHKERGIGQLVDQLEHMLVPCAQAALNHNGNIISVEGDALLITFDKMGDVIGFCRELSQHRSFALKTSDQEYPLQIDIGVSLGNLYEYMAGDGKGKIYLAAGSALREAYRMEKYSKNGQIALSFGFPGAKKADGCYLIEPRDFELSESPLKRLWGKIIGHDRAKNEIHALDAANSVICADPEYVDSLRSPYIPKESRSQLLSPVVMFSDFPLIRLAFSKVRPTDGSQPEPSLAADALDEFFISSREIIERHAEGYIGKFKDINSLFLIGAPRALADSSIRAFEAIDKIHELHRTLCNKYNLPSLPSVTGMHKGDALCGPILGRYDALGSSVNLAARVKESGVQSDEIVESQEGRRKIRFTREMLDGRVSRMIRGYEIERKELKGLEGEEHSILLDFSTIVGFEKKEEFVLRKDELDSLVARARASILQKENGAAINIIGDEGSGKDKLLTLVGVELQDGHEVYEIRCSPFFKKDPYRALFELMKRVMNAYSDDELFTRAIGRTPESGSDFSNALDYFRQMLLENPAAYLINNGDNIDRESADFFGKLAPDFVKAGCFAAYSGSSGIFPEAEDVVLKNLTKEKSVEFAKLVAHKCHPQAELPNHVAEEIFRRSCGNPLFISELVKSLDTRYGRLAFRKAVTGNLKDIMLKNVHEGLSEGLQEAIERYSLMHSVALMAPLIDPDAGSNMKLMRDSGFLRGDFEFASDILQNALAGSMDPRKRQEICTELANAAEAAGMADHLAIFQYYRNSRLTQENRRKALNHADDYVKEKGFLYLIADDFFDEAIAVADTRKKEQRFILGIMLYRKTIVLMAECTDDEHPEKIERMAGLLGLARKSHEYLKGHEIEYKALLQAARSLSYLAYFEMLEQKGHAESREKLAQSKALFEQSKEMAFLAKDTAYFLACSSSFSHSLIYHHKNPAGAYIMLSDTENRYGQLPQGGKEDNIPSRVANLYLTMADAAQMGGDYEVAADKIERALEKNTELGYTEGIAYSLGVKAKILHGRGDFRNAKAFAQQTLDMVRDKRILAVDFEKDMKKIIEAVERRSGMVTGEIG